MLNVRKKSVCKKIKTTLFTVSYLKHMKHTNKTNYFCQTALLYK